MPVYYIELANFGACCLREARTEQAARNAVMREYGRVGLSRLATKEDIEHVKSAGGWVPESKR